MTPLGCVKKVPLWTHPEAQQIMDGVKNTPDAATLTSHVSKNENDHKTSNYYFGICCFSIFKIAG